MLVVVARAAAAAAVGDCFAASMVFVQIES